MSEGVDMTDEEGSYLMVFVEFHSLEGSRPCDDFVRKLGLVVVTALTVDLLVCIACFVCIGMVSWNSCLGGGV